MSPPVHSKNQALLSMSKLNESFVRSILATDAVGFSKLVSQNEYETLASLKICLDIISETIVSKGGRIFHSAGDSVLAEFIHAKDAFDAAIEIQQSLKEHNNQTNLQILKFRIGLDFGDVFADCENLLGEAVNFAARLESFAQPNGVSISKRFFVELGVDNLPVNDHGVQKIKNSKIHSLDLLLPSLKKRRLLTTAQKVKIKLAAAVVSMILVGLAYQNYFVTEYERSTVAVLPLVNLTGDPKLNYIASGLSNEISGSISRVSTISVIANSSVDLITLDNFNLEEISERFSLDHLIYGEVSSEGQKFKVSINLYEAKKNLKKNIYYDHGNLNEVLKNRKNIIVNSLKNIDVPISKPDKTNATRQGTLSLAAYEEFLRGDYNFRLRTPEGTFAAKIHFDNAIRIDPNFARPYGYLAILFSRIRNPRAAVAFDTAVIENALYMSDLMSLVATSIGPSIPETFFARAFVETFHLGEHEAALENVNTALSLNPSYADALGLKASILNALDQPTQALKIMEKAKQINPNFAVEYLVIETLAFMMLEKWVMAKELAILTLERLPEALNARIMLICADIALGNMDDALWNFEELLLLEPSFDATTWILTNNLQRLDQLVVKSFAALAKYAE
tara:strand:- start:80 stop:1951 length:1872 start_codon:yes stop_codon:yes gene_type:complete